jgi:hypothetical protein
MRSSAPLQIVSQLTVARLVLRYVNLCPVIFGSIGICEIRFLHRPSLRSHQGLRADLHAQIYS